MLSGTVLKDFSDSPAAICPERMQFSTEAPCKWAVKNAELKLKKLIISVSNSSRQITSLQSRKLKLWPSWSEPK